MICKDTLSSLILTCEVILIVHVISLPSASLHPVVMNIIIPIKLNTVYSQSHRDSSLNIGCVFIGCVLANLADEYLKVKLWNMK